MKNKKIIYILIPLTLIIWGLIILKIIKHFSHITIPVTNLYTIPKSINKESSADSSTLILNYRDPFLSGTSLSFASSHNADNLISNNNNLTMAPKPAMNFPNTRYSGLVINTKNKHKLGLLKIDNKDFLAREGEEVGGEKILKLYSDSVVISYKKSKKTFFKN